MPAGDRRTDVEQPEPVALPEAARLRLLDRAAQCLGSLEPTEIPQPLRRVARFEPRRRARLAASQIAAALDTDDSFRGRVADTVRQDQPELVAAVAAGELPAAADPVDVAVAAYLLRPAGWPQLLAAAGTVLAQAATDSDDAEVARLREQLDAVRGETDKTVAKVTAQLTEAKAEVRLLRRRVHEERQRTKAAERRAEDAEHAAQQAQADAAAATDRQAADVRKLRAQVAELTTQLEAGRRSARADRSADLARLAVLVDALVDAASGLRRELALPADVRRPADTVTDKYSGEGAVPTVAGYGADLLDRLLAAPQAHLVVDGYNVTKTAWPQLPLENQRSRLLSGLATLASQFRGEVTCVFDGADVGGRVPAPQVRGVRAMFSPAAGSADDVIIELVQAEPPGRPVVVVSSDREVVARARAAGAEAVPAQLLVDRLTPS